MAPAAQKSARKSPAKKASRAKPYTPETYVGHDGIGALITRCKTFIWEGGDRALAAHNITLSQWIVLKTLYHGEELTPATLCAEIGYDTGAMTRMLDRLEKSGFIRRVRRPEDRRSVRLELTPTGRAIYPKLLKAIVGELNAVLEDFTIAEVRLMEALLGRLLTNARARAAQGRGEG